MTRRLRIWLSVIVLGAGMCCGMSHAADPAPRWQTGAAFRVAWRQRIRAQFDQITLRTAMDQLCSERRIAWVADRRLDLDQTVACESIEAPLSDYVSRLVQPLKAGVVVVGSTVVIGPEESTRWLRTLVEKQMLELRQSGVDVARIQSLARPLDLHWDELAEPRTLINHFVQRGKIELEGQERVPYDLWNRGDLVGVTCGEALTILGWQYDLQLVWRSHGSAQLAPMTTPVTISRKIKLSPAQRETAPQKFPEVRWEPELSSSLIGPEVQAHGRVEDLEGLAQWLKGGEGKPRPLPKKPEIGWRQRKFASFKVESAPLLQILNRLQMQGLPIEWDEETLQGAGIDLQTPVDVDLKEPTLEQILEAICKPAQLTFEVTAEGIKLLPE